MGITRKLLSVSTAGLVDFRSDKERTAAYTRQTRNATRRLVRDQQPPAPLGPLLRTGQSPAEGLARLFHETYERLAPDYGYRTREASAVPWEDVPDGNKRLMIATAAEVLERW